MSKEFDMSNEPKPPADEKTKADKKAEPEKPKPTPHISNNPFFLPPKAPPVPPVNRAMLASDNKPFCIPPKVRKSPIASRIGKKPYRRTKRPKHYCDKSTITTTTCVAEQQDAYDSVIAESKDLLAAASQAQSLGRLDIANGYIWLLHARLIGLGKRFDVCRPPDAEPFVVTPLPPGSPMSSDDESPNRKKDDNPLATPSNSRLAAGQPYTPKTKAVRKLASMLPNNIELDAAMMEHLARAAAELHAKRSGKLKPKSPSTDASAFLASTANQRGYLTTVNDGSEAPPPSTGARGKKPATTAMNTLPNANCDIRSLLRGEPTEMMVEQEAIVEEGKEDGATGGEEAQNS